MVVPVTSAVGALRNVRVVVSVIDRFSVPLGKFGGKWKQIGMAVATMEGIFLAVSIAAAKMTKSISDSILEAAADFHDGIYDISAVAQSFGTTSEQVRSVLKDLVIKYPLTGKQGAEALQSIAQMGYGTEQQMRGVADSAVALSIATGTDVNNAAKGLMATMNQFGLGMGDVNRIMNLFASTSFHSASTVDGLIESLKFAGPVAKVAKMSVEDAAAAVSLLRDTGLEYSQSGTVFRMSLIQLAKGTDRARAALKRLGMNYADVNPDMNSFAEILDAFKGKLLGVKDAADIFGARQMAMANLINKGSQAFVNRKKEISNNEEGYTALTEKMKKWSTVVKMVDGDLDILKATIGEGLVPALTKLIGLDEDSGFRGFITRLRELEEQTKDGAFAGIGDVMVSTMNELKGILDELFQEQFKGDIKEVHKWLIGIANVLGKNVVALGRFGKAFASVFIENTKDVDGLRNKMKFFAVALGGIAMTAAIAHDAIAGLNNIVVATFDGYTKMLVGADVLIQKLRLETYKLRNKYEVGRRGDFDDEIKMAEARIKTGMDIMAKPFTESENYISNMTDNVAAGIKDVLDSIDGMGEIYTIGDDDRKFDQVKAWTDPIRDLIDKVYSTPAEKKMLVAIAKDRGIDQKVIDEALYGAMEYMVGGKQVKQIKYWKRELKAPSDIKEATEKLKTTPNKDEDEEKEKSKKELTQFRHDLKMVEMEAKHSHKLIEKNLEYKAKIDMTEFKEQQKQIKEDSKDMFKTMEEGSKATQEIFKGLKDFKGSKSDRWRLQETVEKHVNTQAEMVSATVELQKAQADLYREQAKAIARGDKIKIKVSVLGDTKGWLEGLMGDMFEEIMLQAETETFKAFGYMG